MTNNKLDRFAPGHQGAKSKYFDYGSRGKLAIHVLQLQRSDGSYMALPYVYLSEIDYEPSIGIILKMGEYKITIRGRRLDFLFEQLCMYNVSQIRSAIHQLEDEEPNIEESANDNPVSSNQQNWVNKVSPDKVHIKAEGLDYVESINIEKV